MKVASKSPNSRQTLTLTRKAFGILDSLRGDAPKSVFVEQLLAKEKARQERELFYRDAVNAYTPKVREETLELNEKLPIAEE